MTTIDNLDLSVYNLYAMRTKMLEQINQEFRLHEAGTIPPQTQMVDQYPRMTELDILLGIVPMAAPWAYFLPPKKLRDMRRSPFGFYRVAPSLGSLEQHEEDTDFLEQMECKTTEEKLEKETMKALFDQIDEINDWLGFIIGRIGQFLQG